MIDTKPGFLYSLPKMKIIFTLMFLLLSAATSLASDLSSAYVFPNPCRTGNSVMNFANIAATCTIKIFTPAGELVKNISITSGTGQTTWDLKNDGGENAVPGLYFYLIKSATDSKIGKLVILK